MQYNNPYYNYFQMPTNPIFNPNPTQILPRQQIIQVNGKASVDTIQLEPNSSVLVMDTSAPIVWMCVSDGVGKVTSTPYDITIHQEKPLPDITSFETRIDSLEKSIKELEDKINVKSNVKSYDTTINSEQIDANSKTY